MKKKKNTREQIPVVLRTTKEQSGWTRKVFSSFTYFKRASLLIFRSRYNQREREKESSGETKLYKTDAPVMLGRETRKKHEM